MKEFTDRLNKKRLTALLYTLIVYAFAILCAVSFIFMISDNVHLDFWIMPFFAVIFALLAFLANRLLLSKAKKDYEDDFKANALKCLFEETVENSVFTDGKTDVGAFASQNVLNGIDKEHTEYAFRGSYEGTDFVSVFARDENTFTGWMFEFTFSKQFKRDLQVRRKGSSLCVPPEQVWEDGFSVYETQSEPFNFKYVVNSAVGVDAGAVMCEEAVYAFLSATEKTRARIFASFSGNKLYLFLQGVIPSYDIPLVSPVTETKLRRGLFSDISAALTLALDLDTEKKIWKHKL